MREMIRRVWGVVRHWREVKRAVGTLSHLYGGGGYMEALGGLTEEETAALIEWLPEEGTWVEMGTLFGLTARRVAAAKPKLKIVAVDNFSWNPLGLTREAHKRFTEQILAEEIRRGQVVIKDMDSATFRAECKEAPDAVFLDAEHGYEAVKAEIEWAKKMGVKCICGHDYGNERFGVTKAVKEAFGKVERKGMCWKKLVMVMVMGLVMGAWGRDVVLFIGDGMSVPQRMVAEEFARKAGMGELAMNRMAHEATTRTYSASSLVTDSAAAATAIACGTKTTNGAVGVDSEGARAESVAERARALGKKVGIVTSVTINHATPAGFYAHQPDRAMKREIAQDLIDSGFELFMGGGLAGAGEEFYAQAATQGYEVCEGSEAFYRLKPGEGKIWWRSGEDAMKYAIDAREGPRLPELTKFALEHLSAGGKGFFLMVEGGRIDWAGHANEAATNLRDLLELDKAVKVALEFQKEHPDTLVVVTGDHETGGMSMGFAGTGYAFYMERLAGQRCSAEEFGRKVGELKERGGSFEEAMAMLEEGFGLKAGGEGPMALGEKEVASLRRHFEAGDMADKARRLMNERAGVGWTSGSHTGLPALTTAQGPGAEEFEGALDNTDIAKILKREMVEEGAGIRATDMRRKARAKVLTVDDSDLRVLGKVTYGTQMMEVEIETGKHKGERFRAGNTVRGQLELDTVYKPGDRVLVAMPEMTGKESVLTVREKWRTGAMMATVGLFAALLLIFGGKVGARALISFAACALIIWQVAVPLMVRGWNASVVAFVATAMMTLIIMILVGGNTRKAWVAFGGSMLGVIAALGLAQVMGRMMGVDGATLPYVQTLIYSGAAELDLADVFVAAIIIAGSGAMMDLAMDIAAGVSEVARHNKELGFGELWWSGLRIARATVGTMTTTLLLAYSGGYLTMLMMFAADGTQPWEFVNSPIVAAEVAKTMVGSLAIVLVAPFTALLAAAVMRKR